jgi:methyltransferase (TIGR00027 family)
MRSDRPSATAAVVALNRAASQHGVTSAEGFSDPIAEKLLPAPYRQLASAIAAVTSRWRGAGRLIWLSSLGTADYLALRTLAIDEAIRAATGVEQLVILGAGLDGRAWRMPELSNTTVYEVDHPASQLYKKQQVQALTPTAREVRFVSVDFTRDSLAERLAAAGHDASRPSFWIWEGVIMYLGPEAIAGTAAQVRVLSAPGSRLAATYLTRRDGLARRALGAVVSLLSEPLVFSGDPQEMARYFTEDGFRVVDDSGALDWARRFCATVLVQRFMETERLLVVERC